MHPVLPIILSFTFAIIFLVALLPQVATLDYWSAVQSNMLSSIGTSIGDTIVILFFIMMIMLLVSMIVYKYRS